MRGQRHHGGGWIGTICVLCEQPWDVDGVVSKNVGEKKKLIAIGNPWIPQSSDSVSQCSKV